jgi:hypothetical protein
LIKTVRFILAALAVLVFVTTAQAQKPGVGTWDLTTISPNGEAKSTLVISEVDGKLKAVGKSANGSVAVDGSKITLVVTISFNGSPMTITYTGTLEAAKMGGEADFGGLATGTWSAVAQK